MNKHEIEKNPLTDEWFCTICLRASDHRNKVDAERELSQFKCVQPNEKE